MPHTVEQREEEDGSVAAQVTVCDVGSSKGHEVAASSEHVEHRFSCRGAPSQLPSEESDEDAAQAVEAETLAQLGAHNASDLQDGQQMSPHALFTCVSSSAMKAAYSQLLCFSLCTLTESKKGSCAQATEVKGKPKTCKFTVHEISRQWS